LDVEQLSFVLGKNYVISFQEKESDHFDDIRMKIREGIGFIRRRQADYLLIQLLDAILDNFFETIEDINQDVAKLEEEVYNYPGKETLLKLEKSKKQADLIKKSLTPFLEAINYVLNNRTSLFHQENLKYLNDLKMSCANAIEEADATTRSLESLTNIYYASLSQKMNEIMKVLTTVATIFIPLTFIAGIYGMNFDYMPELHYKNGYFVVWGVMITIFIGMLIYFKKKNWL
jgi:magnesium transporter